MTPQISVIIPNYNHAEFLKQRIDSVIDQTWQDIEIIILDDCSEDNSKEIIEKYRDNPKVIKIVYNESNSGSTFKQWQKGIELAEGKWIWIAESDDWCEPIFLDTLINGVTENCAIAFAQSLIISDSGKILRNSNADFFEQIIGGKEFIKEKMLLDNGITNASMCIFKRELYFNIDKEFTQYKFCGDWLFWISFAMQGDVFISGKILNYFRKHNKDVSGKAYENGLSYIEFFSLINSLEQRKIIDTKKKIDLIEQKFRLFLYDKRLDNTIQKKIKKQFHSLLKSDAYKYMMRYRANQLINIFRSKESSEVN